jgi:hypothetical protein
LGDYFLACFYHRDAQICWLLYVFTVKVMLKIVTKTGLGNTLGDCPGGVAQWTSQPPQEQEDPG